MENFIQSKLKTIAFSKKVKITFSINSVIFSDSFYRIHAKIDRNLVSIYCDWKLDRIIGILGYFIFKRKYKEMKLLTGYISTIFKEEKFTVNEIKKI